MLEDDRGLTIVLRKDGLLFDVTLTLAPMKKGVVAGSCISALVTRRQVHLLPKVAQLFVSVSAKIPVSAFEDGRWPRVTFDPKIQREIDRVVAIFG
ncbi:MAG TPA: hypothetical protein VNM92_05320 [Thermoanaerobaculia bacterium]|nr:hypothetical protein [Thermoanaerobaculia bacterium]